MIARLLRRVARALGFVPVEEVAEYVDMDTLFTALAVSDEERAEALRAVSVFAKAGMMPTEEAAAALVRAVLRSSSTYEEWVAASEKNRRELARIARELEASRG